MNDDNDRTESRSHRLTPRCGWRKTISPVFPVIPGISDTADSPQSNAVSEIEIKMRYLEIWEESNGRASRRKWTYMYSTLRQNRNSKEATYQYDACKEAFFRLISSSLKMAQFCTDEKGHPFLYFSELTKRIIKTLKDNALSSIMPNWSESLHVLTWTRSLTFNLTPRSGHYS